MKKEDVIIRDLKSLIEKIEKGEFKAIESYGWANEILKREFTSEDQGNEILQVATQYTIVHNIIR